MTDNTASLSATIPALTCRRTEKSRANFTMYHLNSASLNANLALDIEQGYDQIESTPEHIRQNYISHVSASIISSVAALESKINEHIVDNKIHISGKILELDNKFFSQFKQINQNKNVISQISLITSAILIYKIINQIMYENTKIENKTEEAVNLIIKIRNALIHFTPEWDNDLIKHKEIERSVKNHFSLSPLYSDESMFFPYRCLSADCAQWATTTSRSFIEKHFNTCQG